MMKINIVLLWTWVAVFKDMVQYLISYFFQYIFSQAFQSLFSKLCLKEFVLTIKHLLIVWLTTNNCISFQNMTQLVGNQLFFHERELEDICRACGLVGFTAIRNRRFVMFSARKPSWVFNSLLVPSSQIALV